jgi:hypothetical protein
MKFKNKPHILRMLPIGILFSAILLACSTENEELFVTEAEVAKEADTGSNEDADTYYVLDDSFTVKSGNTNSYDILINDNIPNLEAARLVDVSKPSNGTIVINEDRTIEYVAPITDMEISDTFSYTVEALDENGDLFTDTGDVTVVVSAEAKNYLFTAEAKKTLRDRFTNGYITGAGFSSDFERIKVYLSDFIESPGANRAELGADNNIDRFTEPIHKVALYAYALDDVEIANVVAQELFETVKANDLNDPFWDIDHNFSVNYGLFIQTAKVKKLKDTYYLIRGVSDVLTETNKNTIETWFEDYKNIVLNWFTSYIEGYVGANWENAGISRAYPENLYVYGDIDPYPLKDVNGNDLTDYGITQFQDLFNNRIHDNVAFLHSWAVYNEDLSLERYTREYFKLVIKYGTWSDGTFWELIRNKSSDNTLGVSYTNVSLTSLVYMAHIDSQANHFPDDKLYDFKTTEGIVTGSTNLTTNPYLGGSTTDGVTEKSIKTLIMGQSKYLRSSAFGGWNDLRYNNGLAMSTENTREDSVNAAVANLYYNSQDLKDYYLYNTSAGYPEKSVHLYGYGLPEDDGAWGSFIIGGAWFEQEGNF